MGPEVVVDSLMDVVVAMIVEMTDNDRKQAANEVLDMPDLLPHCGIGGSNKIHGLGLRGNSRMC